MTRTTALVRVPMRFARSSVCLCAMAAFVACFASPAYCGELTQTQALLTQARYGDGDSRCRAHGQLVALAEYGDIDAQYATGVSYYRGWGVNRDARTAATYLKGATGADHAGAALMCSAIHLIGAGCEQSPEVAYKYLVAAHRLGSAAATRSLAWAVHHDLIDNSQLTPSSDAITHNEHFLLGHLILEEEAIRRRELESLFDINSTNSKEEDAAPLYLEAARRGDAWALFVVGVLCDSYSGIVGNVELTPGGSPGFNPFYNQLLGADEPFALSQAAFASGGFLQNKWHRDFRGEAYRTLQQQLIQRSLSNDLAAMEFYASLLSGSQTGAQFDWAKMNGSDIEKAREVMGRVAKRTRSLAEQGDAEHQFHLARYIEAGVDPASDTLPARHWYERAAEQGHCIAAYRVGKSYEMEATADTADGKRANKWLRYAQQYGIVNLQPDSSLAWYQLP